MLKYKNFFCPRLVLCVMSGSLFVLSLNEVIYSTYSSYSPFLESWRILKSLNMFEGERKYEIHLEYVYIWLFKWPTLTRDWNPMGTSLTLGTLEVTQLY